MSQRSKGSKVGGQTPKPKTNSKEASTPQNPPPSSGKRTMTSPLDELDAKRALLSDSPVGAGSGDIDTGSPIKPSSGLPDKTSEVRNVAFSKDDLAYMADCIKESVLDSITNAIKSSMTTDFKETITQCVQEVVSSVTADLLRDMDSLKTSKTKMLAEIEELKKDNQALKESVTRMAMATDELEQYGRRNAVRVAGIPEETGENTDDLIVKLCDDLGVDVGLEQIGRSHRVGKPPKPTTSAAPKPRSIIVKFTSYRFRNMLYKARFDLQKCGRSGVYINEDLTKTRNTLLYRARLLVKSNALKKAWSTDGTILVKDKHDSLSRISSLSDLAAFM